MAKYDAKNLWTIPPEDDGEPGILLSDRILLYVEAAHLIEPDDFRPQDLRPASYDLHVGDHYYVDDKRFDLGPKQKLSIPANGLVYIATSERFNIPYYLVARYSLRVTQVYRGLLIDNGLQIDPGFHGRIHIPVHNFTDQPRVLTHGEPFLSIDFTMTTTLPQGVSSFDSERDLIRAAKDGTVLGQDNKRIVLFYRDERQLAEQKTPEDFWNRFPGENHESSLLGMDRRLKRGMRQIRITGTIAAAVTILGFLIGLLPWVGQLYLDSHRERLALEKELSDLKEEVNKLKATNPQPASPAASPNPAANTPKQPAKAPAR